MKNEATKKIFENNWDMDTDNEDFSPIEYERRDGFIPASYNKGGFTLRRFTDVMSICGSGDLPAHKKAADRIEQLYTEHLHDCCRMTVEEFKTQFDALDISSIDYPALEKLSHKHKWAEKALLFLESAECNNHEITVMFELRVMFHDKHTASVSAAVNTEAPYHRPSISWSPDTFCEGAKEVEIEYASEEEYEIELEKAVQEVVAAIF